MIVSSLGPLSRCRVVGEEGMQEIERERELIARNQWRHDDKPFIRDLVCAGVLCETSTQDTLSSWRLSSSWSLSGESFTPLLGESSQFFTSFSLVDRMEDSPNL